MIRIVPDKEGRLTQWDKDRKVIVTGLEGGAEVHFASPGDDHGAYVVELTGSEAAIPNILLTMAGVINVYVYPADRTVFAAALPVMAREKPDDYVYTETEVLSYKTLEKQIGNLDELKTTAKDDLVSAINEAAASGGGGKVDAVTVNNAPQPIENKTAKITIDKTTVGLGSVDNTADADKPVSTAQATAIADAKKAGTDAQADVVSLGDTIQFELRGKLDRTEVVSVTSSAISGQAADAKSVYDTIRALPSGTDISLGVTGASVGDIVKVKTVDASGKPTEWESYFPGYHLLCTQTLEEEANAIRWTQDINGKAFDLSGLQEVNLTLSFPADYTSNNLNFYNFGDGYAFSNGDTFRYAIVKNTIFSPKLVYKESIVFKSTDYQWQSNSNAVRKPFYAIVPENTDILHPALIGLAGVKALPVGTIASVYVR